MGAAFLRADLEVKVWKATIVLGASENMEPGRVWRITVDGPVIKCGEDAVCCCDRAATELLSGLLPIKTIVMSSYPDDEVLGVGGAPLQWKVEGGEVA